MSRHASGLTRFAAKREVRRVRARAWRNPNRTHVASDGLAIEDPLLLGQTKQSKLSSRLLFIIACAAVMHVVVLGLFFAAGTIAARFAPEEKEQDKIKVAIVQQAPPPPPPPPPVEPPPPEPEVKKAPEKPKPKPEVKELPPPPPDPIDIPKEVEPPKEPPKPARRIIGVSLESTVQGGAGPSFATGNTRMGSTERTAEKPGDAPELPKDNRELPVETQKAATRIPVDGAKTTPPKRQRAIEPVYPESYRQQGIEGDVTVRVTINVEGKPVAVDVVKPSPNALLNESAKEAAMREVFSPAKRGEEAVEYSLTYTYRFRLDE